MTPKLASMTQMVAVDLAVADDQGGLGEVLKSNGAGMTKTSVPGGR
jgi:hypothetical protein